MRHLLLFLSLLAVAELSFSQDRSPSPNAPVDKPVVVDNMEKLNKVVAPYVAKAKSTYPQAKQRFLAGLPKGQHFFLTAPLKDDQGHEENVFIAVRTIQDGVVSGRIANTIRLVSGYKSGDDYSFAESTLLDWLITKPDGSEEGNFVGNFLDTYDPNQP